MIKLEIQVKILPYKRKEFIQVVKIIGHMTSGSDPATPLTTFQSLNDENIFYCAGNWESREKLKNYMQSNDYEMLIGAVQALGELEHACIHHIHTTEEIRI